jgi:pimeloyl-ACP methyl ester carboxylesterase
MSGKQSIHRVNGVDINVVEMGQGTPTLLFLHYWGGSIRSWLPVMEGLSESQRCVAIDFRGWGRSSQNTTDYRLDTLADDVIGIINDLGLQDFSIVGHSMGGKVAQLVAARRPAGLKMLILMAPAPPSPIGLSEEQRQAMVAAYQTREAMLGVISAIPLSDAHREQIVEDALSGSPEAKRAWPMQGTSEDISDRAARINVPVRVIVGSADVVETESSLRAAFMKVIPGVDFFVLPGVSHMAPLEATTAVVNAIRSV